jgi:tRNA (guanine26-N2/guanine27-N2)-dimethyltransferase
MAAAAIRRNAAFGGAAVSRVLAHQADARLVCMTHEKLFDVVDLDPYGTPSTLLDSAVQAVSEGGLLCCTATDMAVLCGNASEVCWTKYGVYPVKMKACHELALRTLLASIQAAAVRHKRHILPLLSLSVDFYVRVFVRVYTSAAAIKASASKHSYIYQCTGCESRTLQPLGRVTERVRARRPPAAARSRPLS